VRNPVRWCTEVPAGLVQDEQEAAHHQHHGDRAQKAPGAGQHRGADDALPGWAGGRSISPGSAGSRNRARAGRMSVPRSIARICNTVSGNEIAPPDSAEIRKGTTSGTAWVKM
jgi:hypothetical protein